MLISPNVAFALEKLSDRVEQRSWKYEERFVRIEGRYVGFVCGGNLQLSLIRGRTCSDLVFATTAGCQSGRSWIMRPAAFGLHFICQFMGHLIV